MRHSVTLIASVLTLSWIFGSLSTAQEPSLENVMPVVVRTVPAAGADDVDADSTTQIKVTFSKSMTDKSWSWARVTQDSFPTLAQENPPHYEADGRTAVLPVKLERGKTYAVWINTENLRNFKDRDGRAALPYLIVFRTKP